MWVICVSLVVKYGDPTARVYNQKSVPCDLFFVGERKIWQRIFIKKCFLCMVTAICCARLLTDGLRNHMRMLKTGWKWHSELPHGNHITCGCEWNRNNDLSQQIRKDRLCSRHYWVFPHHNAGSSANLKISTTWVPTEVTDWHRHALEHLFCYKGKGYDTCSIGLLPVRSQGSITSNPNQNVHPCTRRMPDTCNQKVKSYATSGKSNNVPFSKV